MWLSRTENKVGREQELILCVSPHPVLNCINFCITAKVLCSCSLQKKSCSTVGQKMCFLLFRLISLQMEGVKRQKGEVVQELF